MKQKLKALASLCLALALTLCLTLPAWAAGGEAAGQRITDQTKGNITLNWDDNDTDEVTSVTAYQVIRVDYQYPTGEDNYEAPKDPEFFWVDGVAGWVRANFSTYIGTGTDKSVTEGFSKIEAVAVEAFTDDLAAAIRKGSDGGIQLSSVGNYTSQTHTISNLEMGSYLILVEGGTKIYSPVFVSLEPEWSKENGWTLPDEPVNVTPKAEDLSLKKKVYDKGTLEEEDYAADSEYAQVAIGDTVTYVVEADVPNYPDNAISTGYKISDNLPDGMTLGKITVYGLNESGNAIELENNEPDKAYTVTQENAQRPTDNQGTQAVDFILDFTYSHIKKYNRIRVVYTATANAKIDVVGDGEGAEKNETGNVNTAYLDYNNNPYENPVGNAEPTWKTASDTATVYTYGIKVTKTDDKDGNKLLAGAEFQVYKVDSPNAEIAEGATPLNFVAVGNNGGAYRFAASTETTETTSTVAVGNETSNNKGNLTLSGLDVGDYILKETKAPDGYNLPSHTFSVKITDGTNANPVTDPDGLVDTDDSSAQDGYNEITVTNTQGFTLPTTGGMGTVLFTAGGVVLMGAGLVLLVVFLRRRRAK